MSWVILGIIIWLVCGILTFKLSSPDDERFTPDIVDIIGGIAITLLGPLSLLVFLLVYYEML